MQNQLTITTTQRQEGRQHNNNIQGSSPNTDTTNQQLKPKTQCFEVFRDDDCLPVGGDVAQLVERRTGTPLRQVRFPGAAREFSARVNFQCRLSYGVRTPPCAIACINICAYVKDPVVHVKIRWVMETLKHLAYTVGWVARLCCSWLSPGKKATRIFHGRNPTRAIQL